MASYPNSIASFRTKENRSGVAYDETKKTVPFAEDNIYQDDEIVAIETELGTLPKGAHADVRTRLEAIEASIGAHHTTHENGGADEISVAGLSGELADAQPPKAHKSSHAAGGGDELLESDIGVLHDITFIIDGGGVAIATGPKGHLEIPFKCEIQRVTLLADVSGSIKIDIWKDTYAQFPPDNDDSICGGNEPEISDGVKDQDATLTDWTKTIAAGDILAFHVDSAETLTRVTLSLKVKIVA